MWNYDFKEMFDNTPNAKMLSTCININTLYNNLNINIYFHVQTFYIIKKNNTIK